MTCAVQLNCPIKAEIRAVDSQSDLRVMINSNSNYNNKNGLRSAYPRKLALDLALLGYLWRRVSRSG